jgi:copper chaperone
MVEREIKIQGMSCHHCVMAVKQELAKLQGVQVKDVKIGSATVAYDEKVVTPLALSAAVEEAGYRVIH